MFERVRREMKDFPDDIPRHVVVVARNIRTRSSSSGCGKVCGGSIKFSRRIITARHTTTKEAKTG